MSMTPQERNKAAAFSQEQIEEMAVCNINGLNLAELSKEIKKISVGSEKYVICTNANQLLLLKISKPSDTEINVIYRDLDGRSVFYMKGLQQQLGITTLTDFNWSQQARSAASTAVLSSGGFQNAAGIDHAKNEQLKEMVKKHVNSPHKPVVPETPETYKTGLTFFGSKPSTTTPSNKITPPETGPGINRNNNRS